MTPESRADLIKRHWRDYRGPWPNGSPVLCLPVRRPLDLNQRIEDTRPVLDKLEFRKEYGRQDGREAMRIVCEGVVVHMEYQ